MGAKVDECDLFLNRWICWQDTILERYYTIYTMIFLEKNKSLA